MPSPTAPPASIRSDSPTSSAPAPRSSRSSGLAPPASPYPQHVDPSPVDSMNSNGTDNTEIDEDSQEGAAEHTPDPELASKSSSPTALELTKIATDLSARSRANSDEAPQSVIRLTPSFKGFLPTASTVDTTTTTTAPAAVERRERNLESPTTPDAALGPDDKRMSINSHLNTDLPVSSSQDRPTPHSQTREEAERDEKPRSRTNSRLQDIPELLSPNSDSHADQSHNSDEPDDEPQELMRALTPAELEVAALRSALIECWTLCNTLASLSSSHRRRIFVNSASSGAQEHAWQSCWRLCQKLYHETARLPSSDPQPTLELCRDFCQALFEVRQRGDETTDSVLRVSFEMNNHLYNTHDRDLPDTFRERTLEFYVTMCHRMMKQRTLLEDGADALLRACWSLAEMLFNLRQAGHESRNSDEDMLGMAVQACWELCDLFREGWSQARPDRTTPRPSQQRFPRHARDSNPSLHSTRPSSSLSSSSYHDAAPSLHPETPITIFDDTTSASSPDSIDVPNILVLGPANNVSVLTRGTHHDRWSSNASTLSGYSESASSKRTSSTATASTEGSHLLRLQYLILRAAMDAGFSRASTQPISTFVKGLSADAFGPLLWQKQLLKHYKSLMHADSSLRALNNLPSKRLKAKDLAKAVNWLARDDKWMWIRDLYRLVCESGVEEAAARGESLRVQV